MPVSERFMQLGDWEVRLIPETPLSVRQAIGKHDSIVVAPSRLPAAETTLSTLVQSARYRGVLTEISQDRTTLRGYGMLYFLGVDESHGNFINSNPTSRAWNGHLSVIDNDNYGIGAGLGWGGLQKQLAVDVPATVWPDAAATSTDLPHTVLARLLFLAGVLGTEFYVTPDGKFYSGGAESTSLFDTGEVVLMRGQEGRDIDLIGLKITEWNVTDDIWDWAYQGFVINDTVGANDIGSTAYYDADGDSTHAMAKVDTDASIDNLTDAALRADALWREAAPRRSIEVSVDTYDPGRWMKPGDFIYAFDPVNKVYDENYGTTYHGVHIHPALVRLYGMEWPIRQGMGVYRLADSNADAQEIIDLTDYVVFESGDCRLEVDAPRRSYDQ